MTVLEQLNVGIVGACGRGRSFKLACDAVDCVRIHAVCDVDEAGLDEAAATLGAAEKYTDYAELLDRSEVDAVILGTPMPFHAPQAVAALRRGIHVLSEVPAGVSMEECRALVAACHESDALYMMAENYTYMLPNVLVRELVCRGEFGEVYYGEAEYLHELKHLNEVTRWRRRWQTGIAGITYPTHCLGPLLQWFAGDRIVSVCCAGSGHHYRDPRGEYYENDDSTVMLGKLRSGGLLKVRLDMLSNRPHAMTNYQLQGTEGCYESSRGGPGDTNKIWLRSRCPDFHTWMALDDLKDEIMPESWREGMKLARQAGHGGGDFFEILDFVEAVLGKRPCELGVHEAMDMTLPGLISQQSILHDSAWLPVPDSREW